MKKFYIIIMALVITISPVISAFPIKITKQNCYRLGALASATISLWKLKNVGMYLKSRLDEGRSFKPALYSSLSHKEFWYAIASGYLAAKLAERSNKEKSSLEEQ